MNRFEQRSTPFLYLAICASIAAVLVADFLMPLGVAVWIIYLVPVVLSLFVWRPIVPVVVGLAASVFMIVDLLSNTSSATFGLARINRSFGVFTIWVIAAIGYQFIRGKLAVKKQEWLQTGQARLGQALVGDQRLDQLGDNALRFLAQYLEAHAGAVFIDDGGVFRRFAAYALPAHGDAPDRFAPGDGLLGQCVKDRRAIVVRDVPDGYFKVGSALGDGRPRHLLIAPAIADDTVNAVIELGFVHPVYDVDMELIDRVSEAISIAIRSAKYRTQLQEFLEETQRQAEELQAQSEELRVSNEELEEQGRALKESQTRLELQQAELEQTNVQLEEQTQLLEGQRDDLERARQTLEGQKRELEQSSRYKSEFLANMSHELRTPLNSSLILAKLLGDNRDGKLSDEQVKYARTIESSGNDLLNLINDILDLSKIEAGHVDIRPDVVRIGRLIESLAHVFQPVADDRGLRLRLAVADGAPDTIVTDAQRLEQVLKNLLSNALKFTPAGEVSLQVNPADDGRIAFAVTDTGIGVPPHQQQVIFEAFRQADGTTNRKYGGTGLGLSISRELVRLLGGDIRLQSDEGRGSTFTVVLPQAYDSALVRPATASPAVADAPASAARGGGSAAAPDSSRQTSPSPEPVRAVHRPRAIDDDRERLTGNSRVILVIEDDAAFARILYDLAQEVDFRCVIATTAEEGLATAVQYVPSAIVLDMKLPDQFGLSVLDRLKRDARTRHIPVHVVSGSDYTQAALALGAVGYMLKPVKREQLVEAFRQLETRLTQRMRRVLIVEDDAVQLDSIRQLLASREVETVGVGSVASCLDQLRSATFDCMVLDLSLPDASGFSLLEKLSQEDTYAFPPAIVYTGRDLTADEEQRLRRYSKSIIIKGAKSPERLLDEVTLFLHQVVAELPEEQQRMLEKARSRDTTLQGRTILVVEDDVRNVFALTSVLEPEGVRVRIARNGREALDVLDRVSTDAGAAEPSTVDLVLMDIMMPEMDGLTAMREIRKRPEWKRLPIIALTAKAMRTDQEQCIEAGANDYLSKPLDVEKLLSLVRVWMPR